MCRMFGFETTVHKVVRGISVSIRFQGSSCMVHVSSLGASRTNMHLISNRWLGLRVAGIHDYDRSFTGPPSHWRSGEFSYAHPFTSGQDESRKNYWGIRTVIDQLTVLRPWWRSEQIQGNYHQIENRTCSTSQGQASRNKANRRRPTPLHMHARLMQNYY